ncbi:regulator [Lysobacteraceae bacterium NML75-0749]|nr:regulator [Xanthomonadaceae bacterium NML75-0749]PJK06007.1 regulator [Xanthomonadaceae bacterium NML91-0268]
MPHSPAEKKRAITRLRRIRGQAESLERAIAAGSSCSEVLQQLAAMRGGINGLMAEVLQGHLRETFGHVGCEDSTDPAHLHMHKAIDEVVALVRSYLK